MQLYFQRVYEQEFSKICKIYIRLGAFYDVPFTFFNSVGIF